MIQVLFLTPWYPNRTDAMFGLFVRKHAEAASRYVNVHVAYIHADPLASSFSYVKKTEENLTEHFLYYPGRTKLQRSAYYLRAWFSLLLKVRHSGFRPDIVHAHILTRTAVIARILQFCWGTPFLITEHWSRYLPGQSTFRSPFHAFITPWVARKAKALLPVSGTLMRAMQSRGIVHPRYQIVPNVVDPAFYDDRQKVKHDKFRFLHVSCFDEKAKNVKGILAAAKALSEIRDDFELLVVGTGVDYQAVREYYKQLGFPEQLVEFTGELSPEEVSRTYAGSDCFILFSNYETAGIVLAESLVSGIPVISTPVGIAPDIITRENGVLVDCGDVGALTQAMQQMLERRGRYDSKAIQAHARPLFSFDAVGRQLHELYSEFIKK